MKRIEEDRSEICLIAENLGFSGKRFLITGATGMIGQNLVALLERITSPNNLIVIGKNTEEAKQVFFDKKYEFSSFEDLSSIEGNVDFVIHLASPTEPSFLKNHPVETIDFIYSSTKRILDFGVSRGSKVLFVSSMEVYGQIDDGFQRTEKQLGFIDLANPRSSYPETKRLCELLCYSYSKELSLNVYIARLAQTFGAGSSINDPRIFGYLARCAKNKENIILKTKGDSFGNYCYLSDTIKAMFFILSNGVSGETYNVVGDDARLSIYEMALMVANKIGNGEISVIINEDPLSPFAPKTALNMSNAKLKEIGWSPSHTLLEMFTRMLDDSENL